MKKLFVSALAVALVFSSCSKDDLSGKNGVGDSGDPTSLGLVLSLPSAGATRATETDNATEDEMNVNTIHLFIFNTDGTPANATNPVLLNLDDFTSSQTATTNTYTLKYSKRVTTSTGAKRVYVGINLSPDFLSDFTAGQTESAMNEFYEPTLAKLIDGDENAIGSAKYLSGDSFEMFTEAVGTPNLVDETDPNWSTKNVVTVDVIRQVAKMTADYDPSSDLNDVSGDSYKLGTHEMKGYNLGQAGLKEMYRYQQSNAAGKRVTTTELTGLGFTYNFVKLNTIGTEINAKQALVPVYNGSGDADNRRTSFFGIENKSLNDIRRETTMAVFWTQFTPEFATVYDYADDQGFTSWTTQDWDTKRPVGDPVDDEDFYIDQVTEAKVEVEAIDYDIEEGSFWVVKTPTEGDKFFYTQAQAQQYIRDYNIERGPLLQLKDATLYQKGHSFFYVPLKSTAGEYEFLRNQYFHLIVNEITGLGNPGTLIPQPGGTDPENPDPIEPGEPTTEVPDPDDPTTETQASIRVNIVVKQWYLQFMDGLQLSK